MARASSDRARRVRLEADDRREQILAAAERVGAPDVIGLRDADGNKRRAARSLGIARSTLYRRVRALGLDLSGATY